jgi:hypothetical protein
VRVSSKTPGDVLSSGSVVRRGEGNGVVTLTGAKTYFGRTTQLVQQARPKLHIDAVMARVVRWLFLVVGVRILTYIINKISRTILKTAFVAIAFVVTGRFVMSAFAMLLLVFITDFAKISLATDHVRPPKTPETWKRRREGRDDQGARSALMLDTASLPGLAGRSSA